MQRVSYRDVARALEKSRGLSTGVLIFLRGKNSYPRVELNRCAVAGVRSSPSPSDQVFRV
jgi:hypothetical protein